MTSLRELAAYLRTSPQQFHDVVHTDFFARVLPARQAFPLRTSQAHLDLVPALAWVFDHASEDGTPSPEAIGRVNAAGFDHRRHGFPSATYDDFARSLTHGLDAIPLDAPTRAAAIACVESVCAVMKQSAHAADIAGLAPAHTAQVASVSRPNRATAVVRLEAGLPLDYHPGQHVPVTCALMPGTWRMLTPAAPADPTGQVEFHVDNASEEAAMLAKAQPGDFWTLGSPRGEFVNFPGFHLIFIAYGTGWAAVRAYLLSLYAAAHAAGTTTGFSTTVYAVANSPGAHYDIDFQLNLTHLAPWITIHHVVAQATDPLLLGARRALPADAPFITAPDPIPVVTAREKLGASSFVLVGPADSVTAGKAGLEAAGVSPRWIECHPWGRQARWDTP